MPEFSKKINIKIDDDPENDIGIGTDLKRREERQESAKKTWLAVFVLALVVCSFWLSFFLGSKILSPVKKLPEIDLTPNADELNPLPVNLPAEKEKEVKTIKIKEPVLKSERIEIPEELKPVPSFAAAL